jgi:hypothetical protein
MRWTIECDACRTRFRPADQPRLPRGAAPRPARPRRVAPPPGPRVGGDSTLVLAVGVCVGVLIVAAALVIFRARLGDPAPPPGQELPAPSYPPERGSGRGER